MCAGGSVSACVMQVCSQVQVHFFDWFTPPSLSGALSCDEEIFTTQQSECDTSVFFFTSLWYILTSLACFSKAGHRETRCDAARVIRCFIDSPTHLAHTGQNKQLQQAFTCGDLAFKNTWVGCLLHLWAKLSSWRLTSLISVWISPTRSNWNIDS